MIGLMLASEYSSIIDGIVNGVVYAVIIWLVYSLARLERKKEPVKPPLLEKAFEVREPMESKIPIALIEIKGIGHRRAKQLRAVGVRTVSDLAKRSAKNLSEKTGIPIKIISKWIIQANEMIK